MKKITAIVLILLLMLSLFACKKDAPLGEEVSEIEISGEVVDGEPESTEEKDAPTTESEATADESGEVIETSSGATEDSFDTYASGGATSLATSKDSSFHVNEAITNDNGFIADESYAVDVAEPEEPIAQRPKIESGVLTAGKWKDSKNLDFWKELVTRQEIMSIMNKVDLHPVNAVPVSVKDSAGNPCYNAKVELLDESDNVIYTAVSDVLGNAYLFYNLNANDNQLPEYIRCGNQKVRFEKDTVTQIALDSESEKVTKLDLMLMVDTTGSMSDELEYLKKELDNVIGQVANENQTLSIRVSVNFYRDEGDEYVIKEFGFTDKTEVALKQLSEQYASGGGDEPEAVHTAFNSIVNGHDWRADAVKLCFLVLDAPPHYESEVQGINATMQGYVESMSAKGIRIIPVASSGVDKHTEILCRNWALMTGGTYTFLTDHSGVGNSHIEPSIGFYQVEKLNSLMVRVIKEYCSIK